MDEKLPRYSPLPTHDSEERGAEKDLTHNPNTAADTRKRHQRLGFLKLCFILFAFFMLLSAIKDNDNNDDDGQKSEKGHHHRHHHHGKHRLPKHLRKYRAKFEEHMQANVDQLVESSLKTEIVWDRLAEMTDTFGARLVGTPALEKSIDWILEQVKADNLSVTTEEVVVDYWERNEESLYFLSPTRGPVQLHMLGLGFSAPTPANGLEAEIIVATSKEELDQLGQQGLVKGKIVLLNKPYEAYEVDYIFRTQGPTWAASHGAAAVLVRAVTGFSLQTPHTGTSNPAGIPAATISIEDASLLARSLQRHQANPEKYPDWPRVRLTMNAKTEFKNRKSRNVIIELKGREIPNEVVVVGGHIDSWDVGVGAVDDGIGCFIAWETLRQLSQLPQAPRRTVRAVFWTSEENGSPGGRVYAENHPETSESRHVFAFESDNGVFDPYGIRFTPGQKKPDAEKPLNKRGDCHSDKNNDGDDDDNDLLIGQEFDDWSVVRAPTGGAKHGKKDKKNKKHKHSNPHDEIVDFSSFEYLVAAGQHYLGSRTEFAFPGAGQYVEKDGSGADINPLCHKGVACAHFLPADPFPEHYPSSPYSLKRGVASTTTAAAARARHNSNDGPLTSNPHRRPIGSGYFYYHHTDADTMDAFTPQQAQQSAAVMAVWTYIAAESLVEF
ncbi:hypothetical protein DFQ27_004667 [Actinomortierella ambigua]|uniref:Peptide hydrolase n=1 Tax=Actinomortierella ambigua TaxID=1343610 RepID=A0A9P6U454_9FUNG|nr:hypothetical protein DFQ27_004667 [Actinomortierella ambigua]